MTGWPALGSILSARANWNFARGFTLLTSSHSTKAGTVTISTLISHADIAARIDDAPSTPIEPHGRGLTAFHAPHTLQQRGRLYD